MIVGILALGHIGGSIARAFKRDDSVTVYAYDTDSRVMEAALALDVIDAPLTMENIKDCDLIMLAAHPVATAEYLKQAAPFIEKHTLVLDCLGTKRTICELGFSLAEQYGFTFVGGHPMAGTQYSGFVSTKPELFDGQPMVLVLPALKEGEDESKNAELVERVKNLIKPLGFGSVNITTAAEHDRMIAFTSQLAHVVSSSYVKSPTAKNHSGFSAGSYKDLTRVAWLNPSMWSELFLENGENLLCEIDCLLENIGNIRRAIAEKDKDTLRDLLEEGRRLKKEIDG